MPDTTQTSAAQPMKRQYLAHFLDASFRGATANYVRLGLDLEEYNESLNPDVESKKNILGEPRIYHRGYEPQSEVSPYYAYDGDPLYTAIAAIANERKTGDDCVTTKVDVLFDAEGTVIWAYRETVLVVVENHGGDTTGVQAAFNLRSLGGRVSGTFDLATRTFTPSGSGTSSGGSGGGT